MFASFSRCVRETPLAPLQLSDKNSDVGKGKRLCLVSDSRARVAPSALDAALWLERNGWDVTWLDTAPKDQSPINGKPDGMKGTYVRLAGLFCETSWHSPLLSLCTYQWLKDKSFDLILFHHSFAGGFFSCVARDYGLSFQTTALVVLADDPYAKWLEDSEYFPPSLRTDSEIDYFERETVARADAVLTTDPTCYDWMARAGWKLPDESARYAVLGGDEGLSVHSWLLCLVDAAKKRTFATKPALVSVCMATYNRPEFLREAIASLTSQTQADFELVIVDDGSTNTAVDALREELAPVFQKRKWQWVKQKNGGPSSARNHAAKLSRGTHILFMDDDDVATPDEIEFFTRAASIGVDAVGCITGFYPTGDDQDAFLPIARLPNRPACKVDFFAVNYIHYGGPAVLSCFINCDGNSNTLYRREVLEKVRGFEGDQLEICEDWQLLTRAKLQGYRVDVLPEVLMLYRMHSSSRIRLNPKVFRGNINHLRILAQHISPLLAPLLLGARAAFGNGMRGGRAPGRFPDPWAPGAYQPHARHRLFRQTAREPDRAISQPKIALCVDDTLVTPACVLLASLFSSCPAPVEVYVLSMMSEDNNARLHDVAAYFGQKLHLVEVRNDANTWLPVTSFGKESSASYLYIQLAKHLPHLDRVIYLGYHTLVRGDLQPLWTIELGDKVLGAVRECKHMPVGNPVPGASDTNHHFNTGVMLINLKKWREKKIGEITLENARNWNYFALNHTVGADWLEIPPMWNFSQHTTPERFGMSHEAFHTLADNPSICCFIHYHKPWFPGDHSHWHYTKEYKIYMKMMAPFLHN